MQVLHLEFESKQLKREGATEEEIIASLAKEVAWIKANEFAFSKVNEVTGEALGSGIKMGYGSGKNHMIKENKKYK